MKEMVKKQGLIWIDLLIIFFSCFILYVGNFVFVNPSGDSIPTSVLPFSILIHHNFYVGKYLMSPGEVVPYYIIQTHGHYISKSPIGAAITAIPVYALYLLFGGVPTANAGAILGKVSSALISSGSVILVYFLMAKIGIKRNIRFIFSFMYGLGSETMSISSQGLWQHGPAEFWIAAFLLFVAFIQYDDNPPSWAFYCVGITAGMILLSRPADLVLVIPFAILWLQRQVRRKVWMSIVGFTPFLIFNMGYDFLFFGHLFSTGYGSVTGVSNFFNFPIILGLLGNLFSPSKGLFAYMPWALLAFAWIGNVRFLRLRGSIYLPSLISVIPFIILYSLYYQWPAGYCYGPRYMTDLLPILTILGAGYIMLRVSNNKTSIWKRRLYHTLVGVTFIWSFSIQFLGTYVTGGGAWNAAARPNTFLQPLWSVRGSEPLYYLNTLKAEYLSPKPIGNPHASFSDIQLLEKPLIYKQGVTPSQFLSDTVYHGTVIVKNTGLIGWSAYPSQSGSNVIHFSYTVWRGNKEIVKNNGIRSALLHSVQPGKSIKIYFQFITPKTPGTYTYVFTLVDEGIRWFQNYINNKNAIIVDIKVIK